MLPSDKTSYTNLFTQTVVDNISLADIWTSWQLSTEIKQSIKGEGQVLVGEHDSWHSISEEIYGTREYWWVLLLFNEVENPFSLFFDDTTDNALKKINVIRPEEINIIVTEVRKIRLLKEVQNG